MKILSFIAAAMILLASCNNSEKEKSGQEFVDTTQTITNIEKTGDERTQKIKDTTGKANDDKKTDINTKPEDSTIKPEAGGTKKWTKLESGTQSKMKDRAVLLISNKEKFDELWKIAFSNTVGPQKPNVNFSENSVVALFLGEVTSGGHSIELLSIRSLTGGDFEISVRHTKPGTGCITASVMEYPYFLALTSEPLSGRPKLNVSTKETKCD